MTGPLALTGAAIFDGETTRHGLALVMEAGRISGLVPEAELSSSVARRRLSGGTILPGFIDLQVNGGGGVMLNDRRDVEGIRAIAAAHARFGTTALLPTLITDRPEVTREAVEAGFAAVQAGVPGFLGLHVEGPHLSLARKGAHDPALIRPMEDADLRLMLEAAAGMPALLVTVAPENVTPAQVSAMAAAGILVSLGHTDSSAQTALAYARAGARCATHLFNAMSQLGNREPGVVGAVLAEGSLHAGMIADGFHVDPLSMAIALRAKAGPGRIFLVTDAMSTIGTDLDHFMLNGREIRREGGRLTLADGTLAGADIDMLSSVLFVHRRLGLPFEEAVRMASLYPAEAIGLAARKGRLAAGFDADCVILDDSHRLVETIIGGETVYRAAGQA